MKKALLLLLLVTGPAFADIVQVDEKVCQIVDKQVDMQAQYMSLPGTTTIDYMYILDLTGNAHRENKRKPDYLATLISKTLALKINGFLNEKKPMSEIKLITSNVCNGLKGRMYELNFDKG